MLNSEDGACGLMGRPRILKSELPITPELRGWSLALMGRPGFQYQNFLSLTNSEGGV